MKQDEQDQLIDFLLGQCEPDVSADIRQRLAHDGRFRAVHDNIAKTLAAMSLVGENEPPENLVSRTLARIRQHQQTNALLAREQLAGRRGRPTFLLRELAAVAAVLVLMLGTFSIWQRQARREHLAGLCRSQVGQIGTGLLTYANAHDGFLPAADLAQHRWLPKPGVPSVSNSSGLFRLVIADFVSSSVFTCPALEADGGSKAGFAVQPGMSDFPGAEDINYSYQHTLGGRRLSRQVLAPVAESMAIMADSTPLFAGGQFRRDRVRTAASDNSDNHGQAGQNVLYLDMHVVWRERPDVGVRGDNIFLAKDIFDYDGDEKPASDIDTFLLPSYSDE